MRIEIFVKKIGMSRARYSTLFRMHLKVTVSMKVSVQRSVRGSNVSLLRSGFLRCIGRLS